MGESFRKSIPNVGGIFETDALRTHGFGNLGKIRVLEFHSERYYAGLFLLFLIQRFKPAGQTGAAH